MDIAREWLAARADPKTVPPVRNIAAVPRNPEPPVVQRTPVVETPEPVRSVGLDEVAAGQQFIRRIDDIRQAVSMIESGAVATMMQSGPEPEQVQSPPPPPEPVRPQSVDPAQEEWARVLIRADVGERTAAEIASAAAAAGSIAEALKGLIKFKGPVTLAENERKIVMFVGPTGVGKTTTLVKVCADFYRKRIPIRFMTIDTYRVGATGQLESYAAIIKAPLDIVRTPEEYRAKLEAASERVVFTDTAGRSPRDEERRKELLSFVKSVPAGFKTEVYLVLSATTAAADMESITKRFEDFPLSGVVITKTDEPEMNGRTLDYLRRTGLPAAYFTTGQSVPEDIVPAGPENLTRLVIPQDAGRS
jgi:flagellar biosynthesis protein FlhF